MIYNLKLNNMILEEKFRSALKDMDLTTDQFISQCVELTEQECISFGRWVNDYILGMDPTKPKTYEEFYKLYLKSKENSL